MLFREGKNLHLLCAWLGSEYECKEGLWICTGRKEGGGGLICNTIGCKVRAPGSVVEQKKSFVAYGLVSQNFVEKILGISHKTSFFEDKFINILSQNSQRFVLIAQNLVEFVKIFDGRILASDNPVLCSVCACIRLSK